jgi:hypothetical protein
VWFCVMKADKVGDNDVVEDSSVLECDATWLGQWLLTFQRTILPSKDQEMLSQKKSIASQGLSGYRARQRVADSWEPVLVVGLSPNK